MNVFYAYRNIEEATLITSKIFVYYKVPTISNKYANKIKRNERHNKKKKSQIKKARWSYNILTYTGTVNKGTRYTG